jgi:hypothetical protein
LQLLRVLLLDELQLGASRWAGSGMIRSSSAEMGPISVSRRGMEETFQEG